MKAASLFFSLAASLLALSGASSAAPLSAELSACIRDNAPKVERAIPNLNEALSFLVYGVCNASLNAEYQKALNLREEQSRAELIKACEQYKPVDKNSPLCSRADLETRTSPDSIGEDVRAYGAQPRSPEAASLAAQTLLDLRLAHQNAKTP